jgi:hypothetical protein
MKNGSRSVPMNTAAAYNGGRGIYYWDARLLWMRFRIGLRGQEYPAALASKTGVNLEYISSAGRTRYELLGYAGKRRPSRSDDESDWYYPGPLQQAVDDGFSSIYTIIKSIMPTTSGGETTTPRILT